MTPPPDPSADRVDPPTLRVLKPTQPAPLSDRTNNIVALIAFVLGGLAVAVVLVEDDRDRSFDGDTTRSVQGDRAIGARDPTRPGS
jgi:hypothetical protein